MENIQEPICYIRKGTKRVHESTDYEESHFEKSMGPIKIFKKSSYLVEQPEIIEIYRQPLVIVQKHSQKSSTLSKINSGEYFNVIAIATIIKLTNFCNVFQNLTG